MAKRRALHRVALNDADHLLLEQAAALFGLNRSDVLRRLLRAAMEETPAFNSAAEQRLAELAQAARGIGRSLGQIQQGLSAGRSLSTDEAEPVWRSLLAYQKDLEAEIIRLMRGQGAGLRKGAGLVPREPS